MALRPAGAALPPIKTVFIILMENNNWSTILAANPPYINSLLALGSHALQYYNPPGLHPSEPNYIWLEAGSNLGLTTDNDPSASNSVSTANHLVTLLKNAGITWKSYQENITGTACPLSSSGLFACKHDPFLFFQDSTGNNNTSNSYCIAHQRPYTELATDLANNTVAQYNWISPNLCDDMHSCSILTGDTWLSNNLPAIMNSQAYKNGGAIFITWDEGEGGSAPGDTADGPIGLIILSPFSKVNYSNSLHYTHSSTLRTIQEIFGVMPFLNDAASATDLSDFFNVGSPPPPSPCDVNGDGVVNVSDVQLEVNMALGISSCTNPSGTCNVTSIQKVVNAALGGTCVSP